jgi:putative transposase
MTAEESCLMMAAVHGYASPQRPTKQIIFENVRLSFDRANKERISAGKTPLRTPCRETVRLAVQKLDPFETEIRRSDIETARRKFAPIGVGLSDLQRPLQRVEMDAWKIDLMTLLASSGLLPHLRNEDLLWTDLDGSKGRWWLYVAICATTKCIVGMTLTRSPNAEAAVECLRMLTCDKGGWADAVGALSPWRMHGVPEHLVTDCGADFTSKRFIGALQDLKITGERAIAGMPHLRGSIERVFRTFGTKLLPRLTGRTFSNVLERAEHPAEINAALTVEDLSYALIRWVVDIYHNTPHAGLGGKTPLQCWDHVSDIYHVNPPPDLRLRRLVFGQKLTRAVDRLGIQVLGVQYHSEVLANWNLHSHSKQVRLCWLDCDVGAIEVELDGTWHTVPAVRAKLFDGQSAQSWLSVARELRASQNARREFDEQIIFAALSDINSRNLAATRQADLSTTNWSEERLSYEEARLFRGFSVVDMPDALVDVGDGLGEMVKIVPAEAIGSGVAKATNKKSQISSQSHQPLQIRSSKSTWSLE